ncbi:Phosphatidylserine decarboxylase [Spraguea lophii 42_110]|uniref:Phosphatidylserine decarboxylase n=1 Tax=Spraguea lophii (strain 42_110) TaxID=1358809 RepID=S7W7M8_SPRLO|nr:Phosphatidylserine decarboxylase [Spraguea lophii 42_110]
MDIPLKPYAIKNNIDIPVKLYRIKSTIDIDLIFEYDMINTIISLKEQEAIRIYFENNININDFEIFYINEGDKIIIKNKNEGIENQVQLGNGIIYFLDDNLLLINKCDNKNKKGEGSEKNMKSKICYKNEKCYVDNIKRGKSKEECLNGKIKILKEDEYTFCNVKKDECCIDYYNEECIKLIEEIDMYNNYQNVQVNKRNILNIIYDILIGKASSFITLIRYFSVMNISGFLWGKNVYYLDRGILKEEYTPAQQKIFLKWLHLDNKLVNKIIRKLTFKTGKFFDNPRSIRHISRFINMYNIDMNEIEDKYFKNFNEFFHRKIKMEMRPLGEGFVSPADCRMAAFYNVEEAKDIWVKGKKFTFENFIFENPIVTSLIFCRLAPSDYHRFHSPIDGKIISIEKIEGNYHSVHPILVNKKDVFTENVRVIIKICRNNNILYFIPIGASLVGSIVLNVNVNDDVKKGDEIGYFKYGGSSIILLTTDEIYLNENIIENSKNKIETYVRVKEMIAK